MIFILYLGLIIITKSNRKYKMAQNIIIPHIQIPQTPNEMNNIFIIQNIPATPIKTKLGPLYDVATEDDRSVQNLNHIFNQIYDLD